MLAQPVSYRGPAHTNCQPDNAVPVPRVNPGIPCHSAGRHCLANASHAVQADGGTAISLAFVRKESRHHPFVQVGPNEIVRGKVWDRVQFAGCCRPDIAARFVPRNDPWLLFTRNPRGPREALAEFELDAATRVGGLEPDHVPLHRAALG